MHIHIRSKGDKRYGWGHVVRASALTRRLREERPEARITLAVEGEQAVVDYAIAHASGDVSVFMQGTGGIGIDEVPDIVVFDLYDTPEEWIAEAGARGARVAVMTDVGKSCPGADLAICPNPPELIETTGETRVVAGPEYVFVPDDIRAVARGPEVAPAVARRLFVNLGGSLRREVFDPVARVLACLAAEGMEGDVLLGFDRDFGRTDFSSIEEKGFRLIDGSEATPAELLAQADMALISAGFIRYAAAAAGVPMVLVSLANHQTRLARLAERDGWARYLGAVNEIDPRSTAERVLGLAEDPGLRAAMVRRGLVAVDGRGLERCAQALLDLAEAPVLGQTGTEKECGRAREN